MSLPDPCILWDGATTNRGYGSVRHAGAVVAAHRLSYVRANGVALEDIEGVMVRHKCDVRNCIQPTHLELGDNSSNMQDRKRANGKFHKLRQSDADAIRELLATGVYQKDVALLYGVDQALISRIKTGKIWPATGGRYVSA